LNLPGFGNRSNQNNTGDILRPTGAAGRYGDTNPQRPVTSETPAIGLNRRHRVLWRSISVTFCYSEFSRKRGLFSELEDFIVSNFQTIFKGELKIYQDTEENDGQQYDTDIGPIDILAVDPKTKSFVVIELKKGRPSDCVVGQVLRYMGWVKKNLCLDGQAVKGLVICRDLDPKLNYALKMTENIDVRYYSVSFKLTETP
jgi:hypothetical protein